MARAKSDVKTFTAAAAPETWQFEDGGRRHNYRLWLTWTGTVGTETVAVTRTPAPEDTATFAAAASPYGPATTEVNLTGLIHRLNFTTGGVWNVGATLRLRVTAWNEGEELPFDTGTRTAVP